MTYILFIYIKKTLFFIFLELTILIIIFLASLWNCQKKYEKLKTIKRNINKKNNVC